MACLLHGIHWVRAVVCLLHGIHWVRAVAAWVHAVVCLLHGVDVPVDELHVRRETRRVPERRLHGPPL